jgi:Tfp pilus assembly protein PilO
MSRGAAFWWERRRMWLPAASLVLVGVALLAGYEVVLADRLGLQTGALERRRAQLDEISHRRREAEGLVARARATRAAIDELYATSLGAEESRLTAVMLEVKHLAHQAGLGGLETISYADEPVVGLPLLKKSITFAADGSYDDLRAFINLLELSPSFLSLDEIRVDEAGDNGRLRLQIRLSTIFRTAELGGGR